MEVRFNLVNKIGKWVKVAKGKTSHRKEYNTIDAAPKVCRVVDVIPPAFSHYRRYNQVNRAKNEAWHFRQKKNTHFA